MVEKQPDKKERKEPTNAQRLSLEYCKSPALMARVLADIFAEIQTEQEMGVHNRAIDEVASVLGEGLPKVLEKMANVILENTVAKD